MKSSIYDRIALDFSIKRKKPWKPLIPLMAFFSKKGFLFNGICLDLGCANGRHFKLFRTSTNRLIGIDNSLEFLKIARENLTDASQYTKEDLTKVQIILGDLVNLPIRTNTIHNIFSIATIHHVSSKAKRKEVISQISNLLKDNGYFFLTVWRKWQKKFKSEFFCDWTKRNFKPNYKKSQKKLGLKEFGDKFIKWTISSENITINRFYHFFSKREIKKLLNSFTIKLLEAKGGPGKKDNFFVLVQK